MKKLSIILGMHRSGIPLAAEISRCMGAYFGGDELSGVVAGNQDRYFGNQEVVHINNSIFQACKKEWYSLETINPDYNNPRIIKAMEQIKITIQKLYDKSDMVAIADPRISVLLPLWNSVLEELEIEVHYIWVVKNPLEVIESLRKRNGYVGQHSLLLWIHYNLSILKYLQGKEYLRINYRDMLEQSWVFEEFSRFFECKLDDRMKCELNYIIRHEYCHSIHRYQEVQSIQNELLTELYGALLQNTKIKVNVSKLENLYEAVIVESDDQFMDYEALENIGCLKGKEIIIYGAGNCGQQAAEMLQQLGYHQYDFCDKDIRKQGTSLMKGRILSIAEVENKDNLLIIIAIENKSIKKEMEQTLKYIEGVNFLSFFALKKIWKYFFVDHSTIASKVEAFSLWYKKLETRSGGIKNACDFPILVYQNGKVGSSTISKSLWNIDVKNAHMHGFFFENDIIGKLILGENQNEFMKKSKIFQIQSKEYSEGIKNAIKGKKIITLIREPIAVDLSTVFQWIGNGIADKYFAEHLGREKTFSQVVSQLMIRVQNRLFNWFDEELKEICGIDVLMYPFDKEKGYTIISENEVEILLIKTEKLSYMESVIGDFIGNPRFELMNENIGKDKEYGHIYKKIKKNLELPKEYVEYYYNNNLYMNHFYSEEEQKSFFSKWMRHVGGNE